MRAFYTLWTASFLLLAAACEFTSNGDPKNSACGQQCPAETPICDLDKKECVQCRDANDCSDEAKPLCEETTGRCGECASSADCTDEAAARCDAATLSCIACQESSDCAGITGKTACDVSAGVCKTACNEDLDAACGGKVCDVTQGTCSEFDPTSADNCQACVADAQCKANHKCVPMQYGDPPEFHGNYCLKIENNDCVEPFTAVISEVSVSSADNADPEGFCGVNPSLTTCEAVLAWSKPCTSDGKCTIDDVEVDVPAAICRPLTGLGNRCTYPCIDSVECNLTRVCEDPEAGIDLYCNID
ncbi:MAG: hypothetical protein IPJ88_11910 [Myxococcales bacterium]|nr:MAG: hypothetical protein IPJ88_11910 [Myxococcales bacterium]